MKASKVLLVDDHSLIREGIKAAILGRKKSKVSILEADSLAAAREVVSKEKPQLVVLDISLPDGNGMDLAEELMGNDPNLKVVMLSMYDDYDYVSRCLEIGVNGYVLKNEGQEIAEALDDIFDGKNYYSSGVRDLIINQYTNRVKKNSDTPIAVDLTKREKEVMRLVIQGQTSGEIAESLFISTRTVDTHRSNIMKKLKVKNSIGLINKVKELRLLD